MKAGYLHLALRDPFNRLSMPWLKAHPDELHQHMIKRREAHSDLLLAAQKFTSDWQLNIDDEAFDTTATEFFAAGALRMPFETTYFEFTNVDPPSDMRMGCIVYEFWAGKIALFPYIWGDGGWSDLGCQVAIDVNKVPFLEVQFPDMEEMPEQAVCDSLLGLCSGAFRTLLSTVLFLSTRVARTSLNSGAPYNVNAKRLAAGRGPLFAHRIIHLGSLAAAKSELGGTHASPALHWRRGHLRHLESGRVVPVAPALVGLAENGFVQKRYVITPDSKMIENAAGGGAA